MDRKTNRGLGIGPRRRAGVAVAILPAVIALTLAACGGGGGGGGGGLPWRLQSHIKTTLLETLLERDPPEALKSCLMPFRRLVLMRPIGPVIKEKMSSLPLITGVDVNHPDLAVKL